MRAFRMPGRLWKGNSGGAESTAPFEELYRRFNAWKLSWPLGELAPNDRIFGSVLIQDAQCIVRLGSGHVGIRPDLF